MIGILLALVSALVFAAVTIMFVSRAKNLDLQRRADYVLKVLKANEGEVNDVCHDSDEQSSVTSASPATIKKHVHVQLPSQASINDWSCHKPGAESPWIGHQSKDDVTWSGSPSWVLLDKSDGSAHEKPNWSGSDRC